MKKDLSQEQRGKCFRKLPKADQRLLIDAFLRLSLDKHSVESSIQQTMDFYGCAHADVICGLKRIADEIPE